MYKKIIIYSTPACPYCKRAKAYLQGKGIEYTDIDVSQNESTQKEMMEKSGTLSVPVINIGDRIITGFDKDKIDEALGI